MSKLLKYTTGFDNNPNSDIAASKRVVKEYKKLLAKEQLKPIIQEMNNQTKSVVTNLNDYSLLLKNITQNLVNAELYLSNPLVSKSKGAGRYKGGVKTKAAIKKEKNAIKTAESKGITNETAASMYILEKYRKVPKGTTMEKQDREMLKAYNVLPNIGRATKADTILGKMQEKDNKPLADANTILEKMGNVEKMLEQMEIAHNKNKVLENEELYTPASTTTLNNTPNITAVKGKKRENDRIFETPRRDPFANQFVQKMYNMSSSSSPLLINPLARRDRNLKTPSSENTSRVSFGLSSRKLDDGKNVDNRNLANIDDEFEGSRFTKNLPSNIDIHGGNPNDGGIDNGDDFMSEEEFDIHSQYPDNEDNISGIEDLYSGDLGIPVEEVEQRYQEEEEEEERKGGEDEKEEEDAHSIMQSIIRNRENTPIRENFIITLFSTIINQVHKASDFWETNITPNLSDIPKLKMDSFIKSNAVNNFEKAIERFEDSLISGVIETKLDYLDNIYHNLTNALDELFTKMNIDIKRYSGGMSSSSSDKPQLMGAGYLPFRGSVYSSHLRDSNTKYLM